MKKLSKIAALAAVTAGSIVGFGGGIASAEHISYEFIDGVCFEIDIEAETSTPVDLSFCGIGEQELPPVDLCVNIPGDQVSIPAGLELTGGRCLTIVQVTTTVASAAPTTTAPTAVAAAAVVPTTVPPAAAPAQLPATGLSMMQAVIAMMLTAFGATAMVVSRRFRSANS
jgi:hypothetical protein